ncbi:zinc finger protein 135 [Castor canadensis]|uniref:Zinc finger protein 135 n=1 Tax=Castor canadensis TaxID=51338 RepID=A0AC58LC13_CASCN
MWGTLGGVVLRSYAQAQSLLVAPTAFVLKNWSWLFPQEARKPGDDHWAPHHQGPDKNIHMRFWPPGKQVTFEDMRTFEEFTQEEWGQLEPAQRTMM